MNRREVDTALDITHCRYCTYKFERSWIMDGITERLRKRWKNFTFLGAISPNLTAYCANSHIP